jgi:hypothetical protein
MVDHQCDMAPSFWIIELIQYPFVVFVGCLVDTDDGIKAHRIPPINEALILLCLPFRASISNRRCLPLAGGSVSPWGNIAWQGSTSVHCHDRNMFGICAFCITEVWWVQSWMHSRSVHEVTLLKRVQHQYIAYIHYAELPTAIWLGPITIPWDLGTLQQIIRQALWSNLKKVQLICVQTNLLTCLILLQQNAQNLVMISVSIPMSWDPYVNSQLIRVVVLPESAQ